MRKSYFKSLIVIVELFVSINISAVERDGIYYRFINDNEVYVTSGKKKYSGYLKIPAKIDNVIWGKPAYDVVGIDSQSFKGCYSLYSVEIPESVRDIFENFTECENLYSINVSSYNKYYSSIDGVLFNKDCTKLIKHLDSNSYYKIPETVREIASNAFQYNYKLEGILIPNSVTNIGHNAFDGCTSLSSIKIPNSVTSIGSGAFAGCSTLTDITLSQNLKYLGARIFENSLWENSQPDGLIYIGNVAYWHKGSILEEYKINIKEGIKTIANSAFLRCKNLISVIIPNSVTSIGTEAFRYSGLTSITIPNSVTYIGSSAFSECSGLTSITIPNSVTSIEYYAFSGCSGLTSITIPNSVTSIGDSAFEGCTGLTSITIPNSVTSIGSHAFSWCTGFTSITIPNSVTYIGQYAFENCDNLIEINSLNEIAPLCSQDIVSDKTYALSTLNIPKGSLSSYKANQQWNKFWNIKEVFETGGLGINTSTANTIRVYTSQKNIIIKGAPINTPIQIYSTSGQMIHSSKSTDDITTIKLSESGIYLIKIENNTYKVNL